MSREFMDKIRRERMVFGRRNGRWPDRLLLGQKEVLTFKDSCEGRYRMIVNVRENADGSVDYTVFGMLIVPVAKDNYFEVASMGISEDEHIRASKRTG